MPNVALRVDGLTKRYGALTAVNDLTLEVYEGEVFGFLGPNGAGKTTSIHMMCGLLQPDAGQVFVHGQRIQDSGAARTRVGVCPQDILVWNTLTCIEQLEFMGEMYGMPRRRARERGQALLQVIELSERRDQQAKTLSGGMQRRLNLIMALVHDPDILVLDEPEAGLDPQSRILVREYIKSLAHDKTIILTTHNMDEADRVADRVAIIDHARLLMIDTPAALKRTVGEGDVLEIEISGAQPTDCAVRALAAIIPNVSTTNHTLVVRARGIVEAMPALLDALRGAGFRPGEVRLRENTLEDVFIGLTGRGLRE